MRRRSAIGWIGALGAALCGGIGMLAGVFAVRSVRRPASGDPLWIPLCALEDIPPDAPLEAEFTFQRWDGWYLEEVTRQVYVQRVGSEFRVFSRRCPHVGCMVRWKSEPGRFNCNCHGARFAADGSLLKGPALRPLEQLESQVNGKQLEVLQA